MHYTSTNDAMYKEAIEKRKIREAIGKMSRGLKHAPVSLVEKKKQQRLIVEIEKNVLQPTTRISECGERVSAGGLNESSCRITVMSNSPSSMLKEGHLSSTKK